MSEAEVARDLHAVLAKFRQGVEIVIDQDDRDWNDQAESWQV